MTGSIRLPVGLNDGLAGLFLTARLKRRRRLRKTKNHL
jgi:hypothetical protein